MNTSNRNSAVEFRESYTVIPLDRLVIPDVIAVFSYPQSGHTLAQTLDTYGIINPVIVSPDTNSDVYNIVCGTKRYRAAQGLGFQDIPAKVIAETPLSEREMFDIAFEDNISVRTLNIIEKAGVISAVTRLLSHSKRGEIDGYLSRLELESGAKSVETYKAIYALEDREKAYILQWNISAGQADRLTWFMVKDRMKLFSIIEEIQLHGGKLKQFAESTFEICTREKKSVDELFHSPVAMSILENSKITLTQKQAKILNWLYIQRYPQLNEHTRAFLEIASSIKNVPAGAFTPPPNFEGDKLRASISFKSLVELGTFCEAMQDDSNRDKIKALLDLL